MDTGFYRTFLLLLSSLVETLNIRVSGFISTIDINPSPPTKPCLKRSAISLYFESVIVDRTLS